MGLLAFQDVIAALRLGSLTTDEQIYHQFLLNAAEAAVQRLCRRKFARATYTDYLDSNDTDEITLRETPVASITSIHADRDRAFGPDTLLDTSKYQLRLDGYANDSESGIVVRINDLWNLNGSSWSRLPGAISTLSRRVPGCIKVVYVGGFATVPYDLRLAICQTVAYLKSTHPFGAGFRSESDEGYSYTLNSTDEEIAKVGSVPGVIATYRRFPV